jgi:hypothetical protein
MIYPQRYFKHNITDWEEAAPLIRVPAYSLSPNLPHDLDRRVPQGCALHMGLLPFLYLHLLHFLREVCGCWNQEDIMISTLKILMICNLRFLTSVNTRRKSLSLSLLRFCNEANNPMSGIVLVSVGLTLMASTVIFRFPETLWMLQ